MSTRSATITRCVALVALAAPLAAQSADTTSYVTTLGKDTTSIEQYVRVGNTITGAWIQRQGDVYVHDYAMVLRPDGWPAHYVMTLYTTRPHTFLMSVTYGRDSATRVMVRDSTAITMRVATTHAYPIAAISVLAWDLALARARTAGTDTSTIGVEYVEVRGPPQALAVKFFGADSVRIGANMSGRVDSNGRLLALRAGPLETRRASSLDVATLVRGFIAADSATKAARVEVSLSPAALRRFAGEYTLSANAVFVITVDGKRLSGRVGQRPPMQLLAASPTTFFLETTTAVTFEFETDAAGNVTAVTLVQGGVRQRAAKTK
ncbi:MAG TPA: DUF3471 domain-containing protein [Gemmatimonadaceae bacterium]